MLRRRVLHITFGSGLQSIHFFVSPRARMIPADGVENIPQCEDPGFRNEQTGVAMRSRVMAETLGSVDQGSLPDIEIEPKAGLPVSCPSPESDFGKATNDFRRLTDVVEAFPLAIEDGLEFGHPEKQAEIQTESNCFVAETDRGFWRNPHDQADGFYA